VVESLSKASKALNRFMGYLAGLYGSRPHHIAVLEPQDPGNPHYHIVLFGVHRIMDHYRLTRFLKKMGFGPIHFEYEVVEDGNSNWVWARSRPKDAKTSNVKEYLKKCLVKTFSSLLSESSERPFNPRPFFGLAELKVSYYFAFNKRFSHALESSLNREE